MRSRVDRMAVAWCGTVAASHRGEAAGTFIARQPAATWVPVRTGGGHQVGVASGTYVPTTANGGCSMRLTRRAPDGCDGPCGRTRARCLRGASDDTDEPRRTTSRSPGRGRRRPEVEEPEEVAEGVTEVPSGSRSPTPGSTGPATSPTTSTSRSTATRSPSRATTTTRRCSTRRCWPSTRATRRPSCSTSRRRPPRPTTRSPAGDPLFTSVEEAIAGRDEILGVPVVLDDIVDAARATTPSTAS
jgi:hypothetical protein